MSHPLSAYVTLVLTESYLAGALVLVSQLRRLDPGRHIACLAVSTLLPEAQQSLAKAFDSVHYVSAIDAGESPELALLNRPELRFAVTKLHAWSLPYQHVVFLDADTLPLQPLDALFAPLEPGVVAASPDTGWPDLFNSGVLALHPDLAIHTKLLAALAERGSLDGSDQGVLNETLQWKRLPFTYNVTVNTAYEYAPAYNRFRDDIKVLHFIGANKPWHENPNAPSSQETQKWHQAYVLSGALPTVRLVNAAFAAKQRRLGSMDQAAATSDTIAYNEDQIIAPPPDYWDAAVHAPFKDSRPEGASIQLVHQIEALQVAVDGSGNVLDAPGSFEMPRHTFPIYGPAVTPLPFESNQVQPERTF